MLPPLKKRSKNLNHTVEQLIEWMASFVEQPNALLGNWAPCPYARQARVNNKIAFVESHPRELVNTVNKSLVLLDDKDVVIVMFDHTQVDHVVLSSLVKSYNNLLMPHDYVILEDHPDDVEYVNGVKMNYGHCGLLVVQKLSKLNAAADRLRDQGYYQHWDKAALDQVVNWRK